MEGIGVNLRVSTDSEQGGRKYMEDVLDWRYVRGSREKGQADLAYYAVYDGHGGPEAATFAKAHLLDEILACKAFWSDDDDEVKRAIKEAFMSTHKLMWKEHPSWNRTNSGFPSTAGTTASVAIIRECKMYVAHVGDSSVVLGLKSDPRMTGLDSHLITEEHKPESPAEKKRIEGSGGMVANKSGVNRVVWHRPRNQHRGPIRRSTPIDHIPFLAVARALGDLWSYNSERDEFVVSPVPDVEVYPLDPTQHKIVVLASDGLWNMVSSSDAVDLVTKVEVENQQEAHIPNFIPVNAAKVLVRTALKRWSWRMMRADNTSVIVLMIDPPGIKVTSPQHLTNPSLGVCNDTTLELCTPPPRNRFLPNQPQPPLSECRIGDHRLNSSNAQFRRRSLQEAGKTYRYRPSSSADRHKRPAHILEPSDMLLKCIQKKDYVRVITARPREINGDDSYRSEKSPSNIPLEVEANIAVELRPKSKSPRCLRTRTPKKLDGSRSPLPAEPRVATSAKSPVKKTLSFDESPKPGAVWIAKSNEDDMEPTLEVAVEEFGEEIVVESETTKGSSSDTENNRNNQNSRLGAKKKVEICKHNPLKRKASPASDCPSRKRASVALKEKQQQSASRRRSLRPHTIPTKYQ